MKCAMTLADRGGLIEKIPSLGSRHVVRVDGKGIAGLTLAVRGLRGGILAESWEHKTECGEKNRRWERTVHVGSFSVFGPRRPADRKRDIHQYRLYHQVAAQR